MLDVVCWVSRGLARGLREGILPSVQYFKFKCISREKGSILVAWDDRHMRCLRLSDASAWPRWCSSGSGSSLCEHFTRGFGRGVAVVFM